MKPKGRHIFLLWCICNFTFARVSGQAEVPNPNIGAGIFWKISGNANTDTANSFLGTTDARYLTLRTNNIRRVTLDTSGRVGIGTTTPKGSLEVVGVADTNLVMAITNYGKPNELWFKRAQGTIASPTTLGTNGSIGRIDARGYDGGNYINAARIEMLVDSSSGSGNMAGRISFLTNPPNSTSAPIERMRINRNGLIGIGTTAPAAKLDVNGDLALRQAVLTLANGANNNVAVSPFPSGSSYYIINGPTAPYNITGLTAGADGRIIILQNATATSLTINEQNTSSSLSNRIITGGGNLLVGINGTATFVYSNADNRWILLTYSNGSLGTSLQWNVLGNAGLNNAVNFLGTTDNADVIIKRQNEEALRVYPGGALIGIGNTFTGMTPIAGAGTRLMWIPAKSAIRAGVVSGTQWNDANIGTQSAAFGSDNIASGFGSFAMGFSDTASASYSTALGRANRALGSNSFSGGENNRAQSYNEFVVGMNATYYVPTSTVSYSAFDRIFNVGNGTASTSRSDALTVLKNGNTGIGTASPHSKLQTTGSFATPFVVANSGVYTLGVNDYTVRRFGGCTGIVIPDATTCLGRIYVIINSNGTGSDVGFTLTNPQIIFDDVTNSIITFLSPNNRITIQSDGTDWIVIGR